MEIPSGVDLKPIIVISSVYTKGIGSIFSYISAI